jgi:translation initiation factor 2 beta subunit (eIF-2beta)/eIF-5
MTENTDFIAPPRSNIEDIIDNVFKIHLNEEILELSNEFCKYYCTTDIEEQEYFAIIFEDNFIPNIRNIDFLYKNPIEGLNKIINYSVVRLSSTKEERLVVLVESYNPQNTLEAYLEKNKSINATELEEIVTNLTNILMNLQDAGIFCCSINPSNIIMQDGSFLALREFIDSYPNFYQKEHYLAPEIIECHPAARFVKSTKSDIYALGVTMLQAYTSRSHWNDHKKIHDYNVARFENTTYKYLLSRVKLPEKLRIFFKCTLRDDASMRWKTSNLKEWLDGNITSTIHESLVDNKNTIGFNNNNYSTIKALSYAMFKHWDETIKFIKDNKLFKWASREQFNNDDLTSIQSLIEKKSDTIFVVTNALNSNNKISKLLSILDKDGSIRQENLALSATSIPIFLHYLVVNNKKELAGKVLKVIKDEAWSPYQKHEDSAGYLSKTQAETLITMASHIQSDEFTTTRGIEKLVYALNPNAICYSSLLKKHYVSTIPELLMSLDYIAEKNPRKFNIDKHIFAFVFAKLNLTEDIRSTILPNFPKISEHPVVRTLGILNVLQQHEPDIEIPNICRVIASDLKELFKNHLHNVEFKDKILSMIDEVTEEGSLSNIIQILSDQQQFINDYNGYYKACKKAKILEQKIKSLNNERKIFNSHLILGQKMTVLVSYVLCFIVTVSVMS